MITIQHLEVQFDVEGDEDEQRFVTFFNKYIDAWSRRRDAQRQNDLAMGKTRSLGDRDHRTVRG